MKKGSFKKGDKRVAKPMGQDQKDKIAVSNKLFQEAMSEKDKKVVMKINQEQVTYKQFHIFETFCTTGNGSVKQTSEICSCSKSYVQALRNKDWWGELTAQAIDARQDWLFNQLSENVPKLASAIVSIWDGTIADPKLASAIVKSLETFNKMGKKHGKAFTEPLTQQRKDLYLVDNSTHNTQVNNINMTEYFQEMTIAEHADYSKTGVIPDRIVKLAGGDVEDTEFEEIED